MEKFEKEEYDFFNNFLNIHFFKGWKNGYSEKDCPNSLELQISRICNTKCSYCYYKNFGEELYPECFDKKENVLGNCKKLLDWVVKENFKYISQFDIFSGEFFNLPYYKDILDIIIDANKKMRTHIPVSIPTNATFCLSENKLKEVQETIEYSRENGTPISLSLSVDGKFLDNDTRALRNGKSYTDEYYDRLFKFAYKNNLAFHPMIGPKGIDKWVDNFDWYVKNMKDYFGCTEKEVYPRIYLLEVRNPDWSEDELFHLGNFIEYLVERTFSQYSGVEDYVHNFLYSRTHDMNICGTLFTKTGRGLGCSIQSTFMTRLGDLSLVPCHRTSYKGYNAGRLEFDKDSNLHLIPENPNLYMFINGFDSNSCSSCINCPINHLCGKFCLGCNYEVNRDFFVPVPTVCKMELVKISSFIKAFKKLGVLDYLYDHYEDLGLYDRITEIKKVEKFIKENKK